MFLAHDPRKVVQFSENVLVFVALSKPFFLVPKTYTIDGNTMRCIQIEKSCSDPAANGKQP